MEFPFHAPTARDRQRDRTRGRLFESAIEAFRREGFDRTSVSTIAKRAGVSRASFYFHFPTKEHVLLALQWNLERGVVEQLAGVTGLRSAMRVFVDGLIEAEDGIGDPQLFRDMLRVYVRRPEGLPLDDQPFPLVREIGRRFAEGARNDDLRAGLEPAQAARLFLTSVFGYLIATDAPPASRRQDLEVLMSLYIEEIPT